MTQRYTKAMLEGQIEHLNRITNSPLKPYIVVDGKLVAQIGNFNLYQAYGAYGLHRICNDGGGVTTPIYGLHTKRDLYYQLRALIDGINFGKGYNHA